MSETILVIVTVGEDGSVNKQDLERVLHGQRGNRLLHPANELLDRSFLVVHRRDDADLPC